MKSCLTNWLVGTACVAAALCNVHTAHGQEVKLEAGGSVKTEGAKADASAKAEGAKPEASAEGAAAHGEAAHGEAKPAAAKHEEAEHDHAEHAEHEEREEEAEPRLVLGVDMVLGYGKSEVVDSQLPAPLATQQTYERTTAKFSTQSFILSGAYELNKNWAIGARLPFTFGTFSVGDRQSRGTGALGNIELEVEYKRELQKNLEFVFALGVALPTAQGDELPEAEALDGLPFGADINNYDRFALQKSAAASRGYEENALFEPKHLGIIPKVALEWRPSPKVRLEPYVKLENLIATTSGQAHGYTGELVAGARAGFLVAPAFEPGVRVWMNGPLSGADFKAVGVAEPELRFHVGNITPLVGVVLPLAGPLTDPYFVGVRVGLYGKF